MAPSLPQRQLRESQRPEVIVDVLTPELIELPTPISTPVASVEFSDRGQQKVQSC
jgi:hypothetical protein